MTGANQLGIVWVLAGGILNGSYFLPMKRMAAWSWENTWMAYSVIAMVIFPWVLAIATVPHLGEVFGHTSWSVLMKVFLFGLGWGVGATLFGQGVSRVGMALGYALVLGIIASFGSFLPLLLLHPEKLLTRQGYFLMAGSGLVILGLFFFAIAGRRREQESNVASSRVAASSFGLGLAICVFAGLFSSMLNFSFMYGVDLQRLSAQYGSSAAMSSNSIWCLALTAGFIANAAYCWQLLSKNHTWHLFVAPGAYLCGVGAVVMALVWFGGIVAYGIGAVSLGNLGGIVGWPLLMSMTVIVANAWGAATGEWKGAKRRSISYWFTGLFTLLLAIYVISLGGPA